LTTLIDFSSLLQLGVGTGIGLGLFQAPIKLRLDPLAESIENQLLILGGTQNDVMKDKLLQLQSLKIDVAVARSNLEKKQKPALICSILGAIINLIMLVIASIYSQTSINYLAILGLIFISVIWFVIILLWMELIAVAELGTATDKYKDMSKNIGLV